MALGAYRYEGLNFLTQTAAHALLGTYQLLGILLLVSKRMRGRVNGLHEVAEGRPIPPQGEHVLVVEGANKSR